MRWVYGLRAAVQIASEIETFERVSRLVSSRNVVMTRSLHVGTLPDIRVFVIWLAVLTQHNT